LSEREVSGVEWRAAIYEIFDTANFQPYAAHRVRTRHCVDVEWFHPLSSDDLHSVCHWMDISRGIAQL
jgi:hypothetical protein